MHICVFSFIWLVTFQNKKLLYDILVLKLNSFFSLWLSQVWDLYFFSYFPWFFQELLCSSTWKNLIQNIFLIFFLDLYSYQYIILINNNTCFKCLMCIKYSLLSCKFATGFSAYLVFILSSKNCKLIRRLCKFSRH